MELLPSCRDSDKSDPAWKRCLVAQGGLSPSTGCFPLPQTPLAMALGFCKGPQTPAWDLPLGAVRPTGSTDGAESPVGLHLGKHSHPTGKMAAF